MNDNETVAATEKIVKNTFRVILSSVELITVNRDEKPVSNAPTFRFATKYPEGLRKLFNGSIKNNEIIVTFIKKLIRHKVIINGAVVALNNANSVLLAFGNVFNAILSRSFFSFVVLHEMSQNEP